MNHHQSSCDIAIAINQKIERKRLREKEWKPDWNPPLWWSSKMEWTGPRTRWSLSHWHRPTFQGFPLHIYLRGVPLRHWTHPRPDIIHHHRGYKIIIKRSHPWACKLVNSAKTSFLVHATSDHGTLQKGNNIPKWGIPRWPMPLQWAMAVPPFHRIAVPFRWRSHLNPRRNTLDFGNSVHRQKHRLNSNETVTIQWTYTEIWWSINCQFGEHRKHEIPSLRCARGSAPRHKST